MGVDPVSFFPLNFAHVAYFRNLHDTSGTICPGTQTTDHEESHEGSESSESDSVESDTGSRLIDLTLNLGSNESYKETAQSTRNSVGRNEATNELEIDCDHSKQSSSSDDDDRMPITIVSATQALMNTLATSSSDGEVW